MSSNNQLVVYRGNENKQIKKYNKKHNQNQKAHNNHKYHQQQNNQLGIKTTPACQKVWNKLSNNVKYRYEKNIEQGLNITSDMIERYSDYFKYIMLHTNNIGSFIDNKTFVNIASIVNIENMMSYERALLIITTNQGKKNIRLLKKDKMKLYEINNKFNILSSDSMYKEKIIYKITFMKNGSKSKPIIFESQQERNKILKLCKQQN